MFLAAPGIAGLGWPELIIIVFVLILLFGAKKLPEMARGTGRALRIFKAETKGLMDNDDDDDDDDDVDVRKSSSQAQITQQTGAAQQAPAPIQQTGATAQSAVSDPTYPVAQPLPPTSTEK